MAHYILNVGYGLGDTHLVSALCREFKRHTSADHVLLRCKQGHVELARMFTGADEVEGVDTDEMACLFGRTSHLNQPTPQSGIPFFAHPSIVRVRPDWCVAHEPMCDAAMYAMILGLPPSSPLELPAISETSREEATELAKRLDIESGKTALLVTQANSWVGPSESFWSHLENKLSASEWKVLRNDPAQIPLRCMLPFSEICGWVIGANCGLMQFVVCGQADCKKTIVTQSFMKAGYPLPVSSDRYRLTRKIDGNTYDIEEYSVREEYYDSVIEMIANGQNARGPKPNPHPIPRFETSVSPGEIIDRLTILRMKMANLPQDKARMVYREAMELRTVRDEIVGKWPEVETFESELLRLNEIAWIENQKLIDAYENSEPEEWDGIKRLGILRAFGRAHRSNQDRIRVKNRIAQICGTEGREQKSYD